MRVVLKGLHKTSKRLADGSTRDYFYAWKGGPRLTSRYGTPAFVAEYNDHHRQRTPSADVSGLIAHYRATELPKLATATQRDYKRYLRMIDDEFGVMSLVAVEQKGSRAVFIDWRNEMADNPRKADLAWSVLQRVFSVAMDQERIARNPCEGGGRLAGSGTRKEIIWTDADIAAMKKTAPAHILEAFTLAIWTGQRQGDLIALTWANYDGKHIRLQQSKGGKRVTVKVSRELKAILDAKRPAAIGGDALDKPILTTRRGQQWTSDGFRTSWAKAVSAAKITGKTFHDLRGTFVTLARRAGLPIEEIAEVTGHSTKDVRSILESHYMASDNKAGDGVILKMERTQRKQNSKPLQTAKPTID